MVSSKNKSNSTPRKDDNFQLKKEIGLLGGTCLVIGVCIGTGIFVSPGKIVIATEGNVGLTLLAWIVSGIICGLSALCYCELGSSIRTSGGDYAYFYAAYGPLPAFLYQWVMCTMAVSMSSAIKLLMFGMHFVALFGIGGVCSEDADKAAKLFGVSLLFVIFSVQMYSTRKSIRLEIFLTATKLSSLLVIVVAGMVYLGKGSSVAELNFGNAFDANQLQRVTVFSVYNSIYFCCYAYTGWQALNSVTEEMKDAHKNLPKAVIIAMLILIATYMLVNVSYFSVLSVEEIVSSEAVAATFGKKLFGNLYWLLPVFICISVTGSLNMGLFAATRVLFVAARQGVMPQIFSMIHIKYYTPLPSLIYQCMFTLIMISVGNFDVLVIAHEFLNWTVYGLSAASLLVLRWKQPNMARPYKVPIFIPIFVCLTSAVLVIMPLVERPSVSILCSLAHIALGVPAYYILARGRPTFHGCLSINNFLQSLVQVAPSAPNATDGK